MFKAIVLATLLVLSTAGSVRAEIEREYYPIVVDTDISTVMALVGVIDDRTALNFDRAIERFGVPKVLILSSDVGLVNQALIIARRVRALGIDTLVPMGEGCYSACSLIFFGGVVRSAEGELGVHQISSERADLERGQISISDILDTLGKFDVPNDLLVDMFRTPPDDMYILSDAEKRRYALLDTSGAGAVAASRPESTTEQRAFDFLDTYIGALSRPGDEGVSTLLALYGSRVRFYGNDWTRGQVFTDKTEFSDRWPIRSYRVLGETVAISCDSAYCSLTSDIDWRVRNPANAKSAGGIMYIELKLRIVGQSFEIVQEDGHVVSRN